MGSRLMLLLLQMVLMLVVLIVVADCRLQVQMVLVVLVASKRGHGQRQLVGRDLQLKWCLSCRRRRCRRRRHRSCCGRRGRRAVAQSQPGPVYAARSLWAQTNRWRHERTIRKAIERLKLLLLLLVVAAGYGLHQ